MAVSKHHKLIAFLMVVILLALPVMAMAADTSGDDYLNGKTAGSQDARGANGITWYAVGCLFGAIGVLAAYVIEPSVPGGNLTGQSAEFVKGYTEGYKSVKKKQQGQQAMSGCLISAVVLIAVSSASSSSSN